MTDGSTSGLQAQLVQAQGKLADCLHCATANTPEGKAQIQVWALRVQALKARIQELEAAKSRSAASLSAAKALEPLSQAPGGTSTGTLAATPGTLGGNLDLSG